MIREGRIDDEDGDGDEVTGFLTIECVRPDGYSFAAPGDRWEVRGCSGEEGEQLVALAMNLRAAGGPVRIPVAAQLRRSGPLRETWRCMRQARGGGRWVKC